LGRLDGNGNLPVSVDFRQLYANVLGPWGGLDATRVLQQRFDTLPLLKA
ncbi:Twin-arginine translocation pathway signal sequence domain-containing protein, partial [Escherichia coli]|nr:Twin-arginine translocation pathway signal sequence domain-containing protein [Escherichia coli]